MADLLSPKKRSGLLKGARAMLGKNGTRKASSESALNVEPSTPTSPAQKAKVRPSSSSKASLMSISEKKKSNRKKTNDSNGPETPKAKQRIRRKSIGETTTPERLDADAGSTIGSDVAVSPTKRKGKVRASSLGPLNAAKPRRRRDDDTSVISSVSKTSRASRREKKEKKGRSNSAGPLAKNRSKRSTRTQTSMDLAANTSPMPLEALLGSPKSGRKTIDSDGKVRRVTKKEQSAEDSEDDMKSKQSSASKRSKGSRVKRLKDRKSGDKDDESVRSERRTRSTEARSHNLDKVELSERRAGRRAAPINDVSNSLPTFPGLDEEVTTKLPSTNHLEDEVTKLNQKIVELNEENLKAQFAAQSETAKLRKELREERLELQRSQTETRELRAEIRDKDLAIDESEMKILALEKAVESQLDKVDDMEEELRRANTEIFDLEGKLADMEQVLTESSAIETTVLQKEKNFDEKRHERMMRRLEDREKEIEERERKVREEKESLRDSLEPQREIDRLEQDNRMLLKTLNKERAEAADRAMEKVEEVKNLQKELKLARMKSYSSVGLGTNDQRLGKLLGDNVHLQRRLDEEVEKSSAALKEKDKIIVSLQNKLQGIGTSEEDEFKVGVTSTAEVEAMKTEEVVLRSKLDGAQRRNQLLEDDIDHWKSVNCQLEDDIEQLKSQVVHWQSKYEEAEDESNSLASSNRNHHFGSNMNNGASAASMALSRKKDDDDDDDHISTISEPAAKIANLWSKLTTPQAKKKKIGNLDSASVSEVLARTTFH